MKKKMFLLAALFSLSTLCPAQEAVEEALKPVPSDRLFTLPSGTLALDIETDDATGECGMGLWVDGVLAVVFYPGEKSQLHVTPGEHEFRLSYEPLPDEPRDDEEKKKFKYCKKKEPEKLGFVKKIEFNEEGPKLLKVRSNKGYLYRIKVRKPEEEQK